MEETKIQEFSHLSACMILSLNLLYTIQAKPLLLQDHTDIQKIIVCSDVV
jgi:hypothetical protein